MRTLVYYVAPHPNGTSARIVAMLKDRLAEGIIYQNLGDATTDRVTIEKGDALVFITATYGDQELNDTMETFILSLDRSMPLTKHIICEVGNYYGYDDYAFGSGKMIETILVERGSQSIMKLCSVDSLPQIDWRHVELWITELDNIISKA